MKEEQLHDALNGLSEDLLAPVDALRRKKRRAWVRWCAPAACLCLVIGIATAGRPENIESSDLQEILSTTTYSGAMKPQEVCPETAEFFATVLEVHPTVILVAPDEGTPEYRCSDKIEAAIPKTAVPALSPGDRVKIAYNGILQETYPARADTVFRIEEVDLP